MKDARKTRTCTETVDDMLDELADRTTEASGSIGSGVVAEALEDRHPDLVGRIRVRWATGGRATTRWVPTLWGLPVRAGDRVLLQQPANWPEPVAVGVLDGYRSRPRPASHPAAGFELRTDEHVEIRGRDGRPILALSAEESGAVVRLLSEDLDIEVPGRLRIRAGELALQAGAGGAEIEARDDVVVRGETIHLN